jgi:hypothetical protein
MTGHFVVAVLPDDTSSPPATRLNVAIPLGEDAEIRDLLAGAR